MVLFGELIRVLALRTADFRMFFLHIQALVS
jgi:hypothetical protein